MLSGKCLDVMSDKRLLTVFDSCQTVTVEAECECLSAMLSGITYGLRYSSPAILAPFFQYYISFHSSLPVEMWT